MPDYKMVLCEEATMHIKNYFELPSTRFDSGPAKGVEARVIIGKQDGAENFCMRVFEIAAQGNTPMHTHGWEHEMFIHSGEGEVFGNGQWNRVKAGNAVFVPANEEHQIRNSGSGKLTVVCLVPSKAPEL
jgi:quercetin dioxygenase-like cupin family protein